MAPTRWFSLADLAARVVALISLSPVDIHVMAQGLKAEDAVKLVNKACR